MTTDTTTMVCEWLTSLDSVESARPITVTLRLGKFVKFAGAEYTLVGSPWPRLYLLGTLPNSIIKLSNSRTKSVRFLDGREEYYVASYMNDDIGPPYGKYHPFGFNFQLFKAEHPDSYGSVREIPMVVSHDNSRNEYERA